MAPQYNFSAGPFPCKDMKWRAFGPEPPTSCPQPIDPQKRPRSGIESWFTENDFNDLFPKANLGHGPSKCRPYNYQAFIIAARYKEILVYSIHFFFYKDQQILFEAGMSLSFSDFLAETS